MYAETLAFRSLSARLIEDLETQAGGICGFVCYALITLPGIAIVDAADSLQLHRH